MSRKRSRAVEVANALKGASSMIERPTKHSKVTRSRTESLVSPPPEHSKPLVEHDSTTSDRKPPGQPGSVLENSRELPIDGSSHGDSMTDLLELLNFTRLDTQTAIASRFSDIANSLMHYHRIEISREDTFEQLELLDIEFYLFKSGCHEDPFTHASVEQSQSGRWYFHRPPRSKPSTTATATGTTSTGYRGGTRKGLDITIGLPPPSPPKTSKYFSTTSTSTTQHEPSSSSTGILRGGILLRSARRTSDGKVISGPSLLVDEILRLNRASSIAELVEVNWGGDISAFPPHHVAPSTSARDSTDTKTIGRPSSMRLVPVRTPKRSSPAHEQSTVLDTKGSPPHPDQVIYKSPRIGLDLTHPSITAASSASSALTHPRVTYIAQPYRFFTHPHLLTANGRGQTFVGVYDRVRLVGRAGAQTEPPLLAEMVRLTGVKEATAAKYLTELHRVEVDEDVAGEDEEGGKVAVRALKQFFGPKGKSVLSSVPPWLRMIGTLRRLQGSPQV